MPLYEFGVGDVFYNTIKAHPSSSFFIYDSKIYLNNRSTQAGANVSSVPNVPAGYVNLFELNIDRIVNSDLTAVIGPSSSVSSSQNVPDTGFIYPFVQKGLQKTAFKNITRQQFIHNYNNGDIITGSYKLSASITRQLYLTSADLTSGFFGSNHTGSALKNSLNYATRLGQHYSFPNKATDIVNLIDIPSIFYGSEIKKGSVELNFYITGTLAGRLTDKYYNGALIQESGTYSTSNDNSIAGVVLYNEGIIILTGSWDLDSGPTLNDKDYLDTSVNTNPRWVRFAMGAQDNVDTGSSLTNGSASYEIKFAGTHKIPNITMLTNANRGELNYTNNPTYIEYNQTASYYPVTGGNFYKENELNIKNIHSSSYTDPTGSLKKTTFITKVGIYDENKKLIGVASLAKPVKKTEDRDLTIKIKMDF